MLQMPFLYMVTSPNCFHPATNMSQEAAPQTEAFIDEVNTWKLAGVVVWHAGLFLLGAMVWSLPPSLSLGQVAAALASSPWFSLLLVYASMTAVLYAQRRVLTTIDVPPLYVTRLGWNSKSWPSLLLSRGFWRQRTWASFGDALLFYASCQASAVIGLQLLQPVGSLKATGRQPLWMYGAVLGVVYALVYLIRGQNVLSFPVLQRQRYFRIKQRLPALTKATLLTSSLSLALSGLISQLLLLLLSSIQQQQQHGKPSTVTAWPSLAAAAAAWRSGALLVFGWAAGAHMLEVVFTERVPMADESDPAPTAHLLAALQHKEPIVQDWCLMDLTAVAEGAAGYTARRAALFADETGASGWTPLSRYCLTELRDFVDVMAAALPAVQGTAANAGAKAAGANAAVRWNTLQLSAGGGQAASRAQDMAMWHLQARHYRLVWCLRSISGLTAAGLQLDKYGLLQLSSPNLADVLSTLLAVVVVLRAFVKHMSAIPSRPAGKLAKLASQLVGIAAGGVGGILFFDSSSSSTSGDAVQHHVDAAALALLDVAQTCVYRVTNTYGAVLGSVVAQSRPLVGTTADVQALLQSFLSYQQ